MKGDYVQNQEWDLVADVGWLERLRVERSRKDGGWVYRGTNYNIVLDVDGKEFSRINGVSFRFVPDE